MVGGHDIDLAVVGSGAAAMSAAIEASRSGHRVVLIERGLVGGTCVNVGCIPSKTLLAAPQTRRAALINPFRGVPTSAGPVDLAVLVAQKNQVIAELREAKYTDVAKAYGFEIISGQATFVNRDTLAVDGQPLRASAFLVAAGARPEMPGLSGLDQVDWLTSTTAMELQKLPRSLIVIGGGYVGLEQAQLFADLGVAVSIVGRLAPRAEPELARRLGAIFAEDGITVVPQRAMAISVGGGETVVTTDSGSKVRGEHILIATGRHACTDGLGLHTAGVSLDDHGFIETDPYQRTSNPRIYAAGDVTSGPQFVYVAAAAGRVAARNALQSNSADAAGDEPAPERVDYTGLPSVIFTRPQLASAAMAEGLRIAAGLFRSRMPTSCCT